MQFRFNHCVPVLGVAFMLSCTQIALAAGDLSNGTLDFHITAQTLTPSQLLDIQSAVEEYTDPVETEEVLPDPGSEPVSAEATPVNESTPSELPETPEITNPVVNLDISATWIEQGESISLNWSSEAVTECSASGHWQGERAISGFTSVGPIFEDSTYTLLCEGENGGAIAIAAVQVRSAMLSWAHSDQNSDGSPLTDLSFHRIYIGSQSGIYDKSIDLGADLSRVTLDLTPGQYYFAISSFDDNNNESGLSREVSKLIQ